jgi:thiol-disulfide isomerase/thioredoxin
VGDHIVSVNREGYLSSPDSMRITVFENQTSTAEFVLAQKVGSISVNSDPEGADIILDHVFTGRTTPDTLFDINWGDHIVSVEKPGFLPSPESLVVAVFESQISSAEFILLDTRYGSLSVSSNISGATICIDSRATAEVTPQVYFNNVPVGTHIVSVFKEGYSNQNPAKEVVTVATGDTVEVDFTLNSAVVGTEVGNITSDFDLQDDYGFWHRLYAYRGFVIMINFWATDCVPCMNELPYLQKIYADYVPDSLILFGLNYWEDFDVIRRVRDEEQLTFTLLKDVDGQVKSDYGVIGTPVTIILDRSGEIHLYWSGWQNPALEATFRAALDELFGK